jgi:hypothetical protein
MRAILIDPEKQTISEIQITDEDRKRESIAIIEYWENDADATGCYGIGGYYCDFDYDERVNGYILKGFNDGEPLVARGVVMHLLSHDSQTILDLKISVEELAKRISWCKA